MRIYILCYLLCMLILGCNPNNKEELTFHDIEIFKGTPGWDLAIAVDNENVVKIKALLERDTILLNYQEPVYGLTMLIRAIGTKKYKSARQLLKSGVNPNIKIKAGTTALFEATSYSWNDTGADGDPKFVKLLLDYGANPNQTYCSPVIEGETDPISCGTSPLMHSVSRGFEKTKLLVQYGADINYKTELGKTASVFALLDQDVQSAYYLIKEKKARVSDPYYYRSMTNDTIINTDDPRYPVNLLLGWVYEIGSEEHIKKMEIVEEFKRQGVDYAKAKKEIRELIMLRIKKLRPTDWQEYLKEY